MADFDEHNPLITSSAGQDNDLSDETQDFRFLSALSSSVILDPNQKFPKRGLKDFEANATKLQATALEASREAMHDALNHTRFHNAKGHVIALFDPVGNGAWVEKAKGTMFNTVGVWKKKEKRSDAPESLDDIEDESGPKQTGALWLRPEEALYLLERGTLDIRWSVSASAESTAISEGDPDEAGIPMSLQGAYAAFIGMEQPGGLTLEEYTVYAGLKRAGYTVIRAPAVATIELAMPKSDAEVPSVNAISRLFADFWKRIVNMEPEHPESRLKDGPLVTPGLYRSYSDIYRLLNVIPYHDPSAPVPQLTQPSDTDDPEILKDGTPRLKITYHAFKASTPYTKRAPPPPDFHIVVMPARSTALPTLCQIDDLMSRVPHDPPKKDNQLYQKLKHGHRNLILAVVDEGITSYTRLSDAGFGLEKIYNAPRGRGGKRGRSTRGRGRGQGRGGGASAG